MPRFPFRRWISFTLGFAAGPAMAAPAATALLTLNDRGYFEMPGLNVMLGSDYCFDMGYERPLEILEQVNITSAQRKMILGQNAARILKI